jgi:hypothetical protein
MLKSSLVILTLTLGSIVGYLFISSTSSSAAEPDELSTLFCSKMESSQSILSTINDGGYEEALQTAEKLVGSGDCQYEISIRWWNKGQAPEEYKLFEEVQCTMSSSGICIAVQPAYTDEGPGYLLVARGELDSSLSHLISN